MGYDMSKSEKAKRFFLTGDLKRALAIYKNFRYDFNEDEKHSIQIAYESLTGKAPFYRSIGIDTDLMITKSVLAISNYLSKNL